MSSTIFSHLPAPGGEDLNGSRNEIVVFDGDGWGMQSGLYVESLTKPLFSTYGFNSFRVKSPVNYGGNMVINGIIITDITDPENETIIYDMQSDPNFSSLSSSSSPLFTTDSFTISTDPENSITLPYTGSSDRYLGIRASLFNGSKIYRIFVNLDNSSHSWRDYWLSIYRSNRDQHLKSSSGSSIVYETPRIYSRDYQIFGTGGTENTQILISGKRSLNDTCFLAMSGTTRHTMHDDAKFDMDGTSTMYMHDESRFDMGDSARVHIHGKALLNMDNTSRLHMHDSSEVGINDGSKFWMAGDDSGSPEVAFNGSCKFFMNGDNSSSNSFKPPGFKPTWNDPIICVNKTHLMYCGTNSGVNTMGTPDEPTPYPFFSIERAKVMIGGSNYNDPRYATTFYKDYPNFTEFRIKNYTLASDMTITNIIITNLRTGEIVYNMSEDTNFSSISSSSSPLFSPGEFTLSTSPNTISFPANQSLTYKYIGIKSSLFPYDITSETGRNRYSVQVTSNSTSPNDISLQAFYQGDARYLLTIPAVGEATYTMPAAVVGSTWVKIGTDEGNVQVHVLNNSFLQMSGNSHSEMHNDSFFIMKNRPENSVLEAKARNLYESANLARGSVTVRAGNTNTYRAEVKSNSDGIFRNYPVTSTAQPSLYNNLTTRLAGTSTSGQIFNFATTAGTSYFAGTYSNVALTWQLLSNVSFTIVRQGTASAPTINELHELPVGGTGIFWEDLTEEEKLPWYKKADNGHEKVEGSPFFQMVNNSSIDLDDGIDITGDSTGLYVNGERLLTNTEYNQLSVASHTNTGAVQLGAEPLSASVDSLVSSNVFIRQSSEPGMLDVFNTSGVKLGKLEMIVEE